MATLLLMDESAGDGARAFLRGVDNAKFRLKVVPGDRLRLEVRLGSRRTNLARAYGTAYLGDRIVAEAELLLGLSTFQHLVRNLSPLPGLGRGQGRLLRPRSPASADQR